MAFYHFLALFPALFVFLGLAGRISHAGLHLKDPISDLSAQLLPGPASQLLQGMLNELSERAMVGAQLLPACIGALWAILNGTWAMIFGLNKAYEVEERRPWWKLAATIAGLAGSLTLSGSVALVLIFFGSKIAGHFSAAVSFRVFEWITLVCLLLFSFALLYRFGPNLRDHKWRWSTPGALFALVLWIGSTVAVRFYFEHINNYQRAYGHLNGVVMLLLWLYVTNGAILIGGEMNSEIEKAGAEKRGSRPDPANRRERSGK